jgi:beta-xylosidase
MHAPTWRLRGMALALAAALVAACAGDATAPRTAAQPETPPATAPVSAPTPAPSPTLNPAVTAYENPVHAGDFPDPFVLRTDRLYYAYATNVGGANVPAMRSVDLVHWDQIGDVMPTLPAWAAANRGLTWAPTLVELESQYVLFYTARDSKKGLQCLGRAVASSPAGPFVDNSTQPFLCQYSLGGSIDPEVFKDADGSLYLIWKNDGNCCHLPVSLWSQRLGPDASALTGERAELVRRDQAWEGPLIEGPSMWHANDRYYLLYSANWYDSDRYAVGYALCDTPAGPCRKPQDGPILRTAAGAAGPGGAAFFADTNGSVWIAYHAWSPPVVGYASGGARSLRLDRVDFGGDQVVIRGLTATPLALK